MSSSCILFIIAPLASGASVASVLPWCFSVFPSSWWATERWRAMVASLCSSRCTAAMQLILETEILRFVPDMWMWRDQMLRNQHRRKWVGKASDPWPLLTCFGQYCCGTIHFYVCHGLFKTSKMTPICYLARLSQWVAGGYSWSLTILVISHKYPCIFPISIPLLRWLAD